MSDTCIVCLGDLSTGIGGAASPSNTLAKSPLQQDASAVLTPAAVLPTPAIDHDETHGAELIAHLQPCGHDLHNECLTPWVERANSCPICRASFHLVELLDKVGGDVISSYPVEDRTQVAELDPGMFLEIPDEEEDDQPCQACGEDDNEDVLMYCDGCQKMWHTYCVGLQEVPYGHWFCDNCRAQRDVDPRPRGQSRTTRSSRRRTRAQQRRQRGQQHAHDSSWNQVWQSVWTRINIDLDFPYEEDEPQATVMRRHRQSVESSRQAHDAWLRRMRVAELAGAGGSFRATEPAILDHPDDEPSPTRRIRRPSPLPQVQTADEMMAWSAFDQARATGDEATTRRRKRKSRTSSPVEQAEAATPTSVKRRKTEEPKSRENSHVRGSSSRLRPPSRPSSPIPPRVPLNHDLAGPSFLQSLLQEVEESSSAAPSVATMHRPSSRTVGSPPAEQVSPHPSSPALSPLPSNHSSPRAMSATPPPPSSAIRPNSPTGLSSSIQPVFPLTEYSPQRSVSPEPRERLAEALPRVNGIKAVPTISIAQPRPKNRVPRILEQTSPSGGQIRSDDASPTRASMSLTAKSDVQRLVSAALKPHYNDQTISKDEYTMINRDISRMLYDKIGDFETLDLDLRAKWEKVAGDEVNKAVGALKAEA